MALFGKRYTPAASLPAFGLWAPPAERGPSLESIYRVSLTDDLCEGNKIISLKHLFHHSQLGAPQKEKNPWPWARAQCAHWLRRPWYTPYRYRHMGHSQTSLNVYREVDNPLKWISLAWSRLDTMYSIKHA